MTENLTKLLQKIASKKKTSPLYDQKLFAICGELLQKKEPVGFCQACTQIGNSLRDDFCDDDLNANEQQFDPRNLQTPSMRLDLSQLKPLLPKMDPSKEYTLVLDLDETLVHYDECSEDVFERPFVVEFLQQMSKYYELVIFTAGMQEYADWAL